MSRRQLSGASQCSRRRRPQAIKCHCHCVRPLPLPPRHPGTFSCAPAARMTLVSVCARSLFLLSAGYLSDSYPYHKCFVSFSPSHLHHPLCILIHSFPSCPSIFLSYLSLSLPVFGRHIFPLPSSFHGTSFNPSPSLSFSSTVFLILFPDLIHLTAFSLTTFLFLFTSLSRHYFQISIFFSSFYFYDLPIPLLSLSLSLTICTLLFLFFLSYHHHISPLYVCLSFSCVSLPLFPFACSLFFKSYSLYIKGKKHL